MSSKVQRRRGSIDLDVTLGPRFLLLRLPVSLFLIIIIREVKGHAESFTKFIGSGTSRTNDTPSIFAIDFEFDALNRTLIKSRR
jgi:hypothetical protein